MLGATLRNYAVLLLMGSLCVPLLAQTYRCEQGRIVFRSEAPLEIIQAQSRYLRGVIDTTTRQFAWSVRINTFEGFNSPLQREHFNEDYMESEKYPEATFTGRIIEAVEWNKKGIYEVRAKGKLVIHGWEQERILRANLEVESWRLRVKAQFTVMLADHGITIPRAVFQKIAEEIQVTVEAELKPAK
jgi:hypothetical protein